jgi:hypothetical protein
MSSVIGFSVYRGKTFMDTYTYNSFGWDSRNTVRQNIYPYYGFPTVLYNTTADADMSCSPGVAAYCCSSEAAPQSLAIGAGEAKQQEDRSINGVHSDIPDLDDYSAKAIHTFSVLPVSLEYLKDLLKQKGSKVSSGPFAGIPITHK